MINKYWHLYQQSHHSSAHHNNYNNNKIIRSRMESFEKKKELTSMNVCMNHLSYIAFSLNYLWRISQNFVGNFCKCHWLLFSPTILLGGFFLGLFFFSSIDPPLFSGFDKTIWVFFSWLNSFLCLRLFRYFSGLLMCKLSLCWLHKLFFFMLIFL